MLGQESKANWKSPPKPRTAIRISCGLAPCCSLAIIPGLYSGFLSLLSLTGEDARVTCDGKSRMHSRFRAPSSPLLLTLGRILSAICLILIYNTFGNTHLEKITTWYRQWADVYATLGLCSGEWAQGEMLGLIRTQSNERSKAGPVIVQNYLILILTILFYSLFPCLLCCHKANSRYRQPGTASKRGSPTRATRTTRR